MLALADSKTVSDDKQKICPQPPPKTDTPTAKALESDLKKLLDERSKLDNFWAEPPTNNKNK